MRRPNPLRSAAFLFLFLTSAAVAAQTIAEKPVSSLLYGPVSNFGRHGLAVASDGNGFLAAWSFDEAIVVAPLAADGSTLTPSEMSFDILAMQARSAA